MKNQHLIHFREPYSTLEFHFARKRKWESGVREYRTNPSDPFQGDHCEEAYQECLDLYNIIEDLERQYGVNMQISKGMAYQIAMTILAQKKRLNGQ